MIAAMLRPGDLCTFRTSPVTEFSESPTGRHAALKVLSSGESVIYMMLDGVFTERPTLQQAICLPVLYNVRFKFKNTIAVHSTSPKWDIDLLDFVVLDNVEVTTSELGLIPRYPSLGTWGIASADAEGEWRWRHDREALKREVDLDTSAREARRQAELARYQTRLKHLTWEILLAETPFSRWAPSPPFPPDGFIKALRSGFRDAVLELQAMGAKPSKKDVRRVLSNLVDQINSLDGAHGQIIETEEREDLCAALEELAFVARHPILMEDVQNWRSW